MFYIVLLVVISFSNFMQKGKLVHGANKGDNCFLPIYTYSGENSYTASLCNNNEFFLFIARINKQNPEENSFNNISDIIFSTQHS